MKQILLTLLIFTLLEKCHSAISNNQYDGLTIYIDPDIDVEENQRDDFITALKDLVTKASSALYTASHNRISLGEVEIIVPNTWSLKDSPTVVGLKIIQPHIEVTEDGLGGAAPYTVQSGQCGAPGLKISLPRSYVLDDSVQSNYGDPGKFMANELLKFRYGIYDEFSSSFLAAPKYSFYDKARFEARVTGCTDSKTIQGNWQNSNRENCDVAEYDANCRMIIDSIDANYSTLFVTHIDQVNTVCDENTHDFTPPTLHNLICGKSVLSVMLNHTDFQEAQNVPGNDRAVKDPTFSLTQMKYLPTVILLDVNGGKYKDTRGDVTVILTRIKETLRLIVESQTVPSLGLAIVQGNTDDEYNFQFFKDVTYTSIEELDADELISFIPQLPFKNNSTLIGRAINDTIQRLEEDNSGISTNVLVIQMKVADDDIPEFGELTNEYFLSAVVYGGESNNEWMEDFTNQFSGESYFVVNYDARAAVSSILTLTSDIELITLYQEKIYASSSYKVDVYISENMGIDTTFGIQMEKGVVKGMVILGPNGTIENNLEEENKYSRPFPNIFNKTYTIADAGEGWWSLILVVGRDNIFSTWITSQPRENESVVNAELWTSSASDVHDLADSPLAFFVSLRLGPQPISGAEVYLKIYSTNSDSVELILNLMDDGSFSPDMFQNDGIYSGYLRDIDELGLNMDEIEINMDIIVQSYTENPSTLSTVSRENTKDPFLNDPLPNAITMSFTHQFLSKRTLIIKGAAAYDPPPSKIFDFHVADVYSEDGEVKVNVQWTAPGENFTDGTVDYYDIRYVSNKALREDFESWTPVVVKQLNEALIPQESGAFESTIISFERDLNVYFIAIRGVDAAGNQGPISPMQSFLPFIKPGDFVGSAAFIILIIFCVTLIVGGAAGGVYYALQKGGSLNDITSRFRRGGDT